MTNRKSPHLEVIPGQTPSAELSAAMASLQERRRRPRIGLSTEQFRLARNGKVFSISDLSTGGMAIRVLDAQDLMLFPVASEFDGTLNLRGHRVEVKARVRHLGSELVGCEFENASQELKGILLRFLDPELLGREIKPIPSSEPGTTWYHGPSGTDLLFVRRADGQFYRFTVFVLGNYVQWDEDGGLVTGVTRETRQPGENWGIVRMDTLLLDPDRQPDAAKLSVAKVLVLSSNLPEDLKKWLVRHLEAES